MVAAHLAHAILFVHLVSGIILVLGAATRIMSGVNIPILAGAVLFNVQNLLNVGDNYIELEMAAVALLGCILVFFMGGGRFSLDGRKKRQEIEAGD